MCAFSLLTKCKQLAITLANPQHVVPNPPAQPSSILSARHLPSYRAELAAKRKLERDAQLQAQAQIPDRVLSGLAALGCTEPEIQHLLACSPDFLASKSDILASGRTRLKHSLRRAQLKQALKGNASMLIWLGKTYLGQKDQPDTNLSQHTNIVVDAALLSNLQQSYQSTLSDIRRTKALSPPDKLSSDPISSLHSRMFPPRMRVERYPNPERR